MHEVIENTKKSIENSISEDEELYGTKIDYILINPNNNDTISIISDGQEKIVEFTPYTKEMKTGYSHIAEWAYNFDEYLFQELEQGYQIGYMSTENHYGVWNSIDELYPEDINYKNGVQLYLQYCADNGITKEDIDKEMKLDTPDIMKYFEGLGLHEIMTYKGYVIESDDTNYDNPKENIVNIYKSQEDFDRVIKGEYLCDNHVEQEKTLNIKFIGIDNWDRPVYKDKDGTIYKDINLGNGVLALTTSVNNDFYGEPDCSIKDNVKINIVQKLENEQQRSSHEQDR